ncbi:unnamed protein product [Albugo candida]|uniref:PWI domain-containing protein n=1 Tax=Albugo candida TaxID=65357 RepID=A0A024GF22_9STRA|nr:unnamed protein product [Albugo candida]|eukprot:CCI44907.1 unnamed protein product [Albugo candida]
MTYTGDYVFTKTLTEQEKLQIQEKAITKLTEIIGVEVDNVMAEYVLVMVANKKSMTQIAHDLIDFIGDEAANEFVTWLSTALPTFETPTGSSEKSKVSAESSTNPINEIKRESSHEKKVKTSHTKTSKSTKKRDVKDESNHKSSTKSSTKTTIKLSRSKDQDIKQVLAKRSQRFGITKENTEDTRHEEGTNKRKSSKMDSNSQKKASRVTELLGPPVNVDQAQLDARDGRKHRRTRSRSPTRNTSDRTLTGTPQRSQRDSNTAEANTRQRRTGEWASTGKDKSMQSSSPSHEKMHKKRYEQHAYGYPVPRGFNGYPPMPYGPPGAGMFFGGPGPCPPPMPYGMGFPSPGYPTHPNAAKRFNEPMAGPVPMSAPSGMTRRNPGRIFPRGRPFLNKSWVNPETAKKTESNEQPLGNEDGAVTITYNPPQNSKFTSHVTRPRFQNKTWVRTETQNESDLSESLPVTPPQESKE